MLEGRGKEVKKMHHLHCAAHILLGFHTYVLNSLKEFMPSEEQKHPLPLFLHNASAIFGPCGDYKGLRNQWEGFCMKKEQKSLIKNYKDNRFNGLFEVAAQVFHHRQDFLAVLEMQPSLNFTQAKLQKSLKDPALVTSIECLALFFHAVTGPFWTMVSSSKISHQEFQSIISHLQKDLQKCKDDPHFFFHPDAFKFMTFPNTSPDTKEKLPSSINTDNMKIVMSLISKGLLQTLEKQLANILNPTEEVKVVAPLTKLVSERHFGHLDASQKRRPHSSLHHHSSIILLKQTRQRLRVWYHSLTAAEQSQLWKRVKQVSREMRAKHQDRDRTAIIQSLKLKTLPEAEMAASTQSKIDLRQGQMIAVACLDTWYPGKDVLL